MNMEYSLKEIENVATALILQFSDHKVIAFHGSMGAGKTTLIQTICKKLGVRDSMGSPTFSIINEYHPETPVEGPPPIYHMDLYRLKNEAEAIAAGVEDALYSGSICFLEWPEKAPDLLPEDTLHVYIELKEAEIRCIKTTKKA